MLSPGSASGEGEDEEDVETLAPPAGTFKWDAAIIGVLKEATDNELPVKRIRKKVGRGTADEPGHGTADEPAHLVHLAHLAHLGHFPAATLTHI